MNALATETYLTALAVTVPALGALTFEAMVAAWFARLEVVDPDLCRSFSGDAELEAEQVAFLAAHGWTLENYNAHTVWKAVCDHKAARGDELPEGGGVDRPPPSP